MQLDASHRRIDVRHIENGHADPLYGVAELPDLLIFHAGTSGVAEIEALIERPASRRPPSTVIGPANDMNLIRLAMKGGARDYLQEPVSTEELLKNEAFILFAGSKEAGQ